MARRNKQVVTAPETTQPQEQVVMVNGVAMTISQIQALAAQHQTLTQQTAQADKPEWYGGFKAFGKGTVTKPYQGQPGHPSPKGYIQFHTVKGVHPSQLSSLPKSPSGVLTLAMLFADAAEAIIDEAKQFVFDDYITEHWQDILKRFGE